MVDSVLHPMRIAAITGTNGKSSCTHFYAQALTALGHDCGVVGTLGQGVWPHLSAEHMMSPDGSHMMTMPDAKQMAPILAAFHTQQVPFGAIEASSHGLAQHRLGDLTVHQAVLTNITQDHLDYHGDMQSYQEAKRLLFERDVAWRILNHDDAVGRAWAKHYAGRSVLTYGMASSHGLPDVYAEQVDCADARGFAVTLQTPWGRTSFTCPLTGRFNVSNSLVVAALLGSLDLFSIDAIGEALSALHGVHGRMQQVSISGAEASDLPTVIVDYAHTPDALQQVLTALRPACQGALWCVLGCGGGRDRSKRPRMAAIAESISDHVVFTDDNPRHESPEAIVRDMRAGLRYADAVQYMANRAKAIQHAVQSAEACDMILITGKGHETVQIMGDQRLFFDDISQARAALITRRETA